MSIIFPFLHSFIFSLILTFTPPSSKRRPVSHHPQPFDVLPRRQSAVTVASHSDDVSSNSSSSASDEDEPLGFHVDRANSVSSNMSVRRRIPSRNTTGGSWEQSLAFQPLQNQISSDAFKIMTPEQQQQFWMQYYVRI